MFSHARVRRLSRKSSSGSRPSSQPSSRPASIYSQALTEEEKIINEAPRHSSKSRFSVYFESLEELKAWFDSSDILNESDQLCVPRFDIHQYQRATPKEKQGTINLSVCHDFKGNYQPNEDLNPLGYFPHPNGLHYYLQFPHLVDHFIYFSHYFISVPTVSWINNCHRNGIPCLGTIIAEGNTTDKFYLLSQLCTKNSNHEYIYIKMLVKLFEHYRFDGYLVNIESKFLNSSEAHEIVNFVDQLKVSLHAVSSSSKVIWYDSFVPSLNKVKYENGVSPLNYSLFKASDYFLTNYWWNEDTLKKNVAIAGLHGIKSSLFVGIDMWGRGMKIGSGGYDAPIAINFCDAYDSNVCLFAPAWTYEKLGQENFLDNDCKLWYYDESTSNDTITTYIKPYSVCCFYPFANASNISPSKKHSFVFYTNFSNGQGKSFFIQGKSLFNNYWVNNGYQYQIPEIVFGKQSKLLTVSIDNDDCYMGGSSLKIVKNNSLISFDDKDTVSPEELAKCLFKFDVDCKSENLKIKLNYKYSFVNKEKSDTERSDFTDSDSVFSYAELDGYFQLQVKYRIERRYKKTHKVNDGILKVPLDMGKLSFKSSFFETEWKNVELTFPTPKVVKWEHCVLDSVDVCWVSNKTGRSLYNNDVKLFSTVYKVNEEGSGSQLADSEISSNTEEDEEWIILPDNSMPTSVTQLLIGDISISSILDEDVSSYPSFANKIKALESVSMLNTGDIFIKWVDYTNSLTRASYWFVFVNDEFIGIAQSNCWEIDLKRVLDEESEKKKALRVRIDSVSVTGDIVRGDEISVTY